MDSSATFHGRKDIRLGCIAVWKSRRLRGSVVPRIVSRRSISKSEMGAWIVSARYRTRSELRRAASDSGDSGTGPDRVCRGDG